MVSPIFSDSARLFPPPAETQTDKQGQTFLKDAYGPADSKTFQPTASANSFLPDFIVSGSAQEQTDNASPKLATGKFEGQDPLEVNVVKDAIFEKKSFNDPENVRRAANALARDMERMLLYMALVKYDTDRFSQADEATLKPLLPAIALEFSLMKERVSKRIETFGLSADATKEMTDLLEKIDNGMVSKPETI